MHHGSPRRQHAAVVVALTRSPPAPPIPQHGKYGWPAMPHLSPVTVGATFPVCRATRPERHLHLARANPCPLQPLVLTPSTITANYAPQPFTSHLVAWTPSSHSPALTVSPALRSPQPRGHAPSYRPASVAAPPHARRSRLCFRWHSIPNYCRSQVPRKMSAASGMPHVSDPCREIFHVRVFAP